MAEEMTLQQISAENLHQKFENGEQPVLINALSQEEYTDKRIPGSVNVPAEKAEWAEGIVPDKSQDIVVYCAGADCPASSELADKLQEKGYNEVSDFKKGMQGWDDAGYNFTGSDLN